MYDVTITDTGLARIAAALYAPRSNLSVLMAEHDIFGGQMDNTAEVENCPGLGSIMGPELVYRMYENVGGFGTENAYGIVIGIEDHRSCKGVICDDKSRGAKTVIAATGHEHRKLGVKGEKGFTSHGVSYYIICDGAFFKDRRLAVTSNGDSAVEEAVYLTQSTSEVVIIHHRDELRARKITQGRTFTNEKTSFVWDIVVEGIVSNEMVMASMKARNVRTDGVSKIEANGVFTYVGLDPLTEPFKKAGITNKAGWAEADQKMGTKVLGAYAIGSAREKTLRQITTTVGKGGVAE